MKIFQQSSARGQRSQPLGANPGGNRRHAGFTLIEIVMVMVLAAVLIVAALSTVQLLDRSSRRQGLDTTALELAQGKIEELQATAYNPPLTPYYATNSTVTSNVVLLLDKTGTSNLVTGVMTTTIAPLTSGHLVTVIVAATNANQTLVAQLQTLINKNTGGQP